MEAVSLIWANIRAAFGRRTGPARCKNPGQSRTTEKPTAKPHATHHADKHPTLLRDTPDTRVANDADREAGRETGEPDREACAELDEAGVERHGRLEAARDQDRHDETVNLVPVHARSSGRSAWGA